ncbi:MFS transporter, partial [Actinoplanes sp. NPDC051851]|uniref:MFS transporter n=1 Tax=Actinoplanes sp. NPDC051851 TaxID=3154753 RepID=UPI00344880ED
GGPGTGGPGTGGPGTGGPGTGGPGTGGPERSRLRPRDLLDGWRTILGHPALRPWFFNTVLVNGLIMAASPLMAVLMLDRLGFPPWQYGLAFGLPCLGGLLGSRLARPLATRFGDQSILFTFGVLRACWPLGLAFVTPGIPGLAVVLTVQLGLVTCMGVFNPVFAAHRLSRIPADRTARVLSAWSVTSNTTIAALTALWGLLATLTSPRTAVAAAGLLILATPFLVPRRTHTEHTAPAPLPA